MSLPTILGSGEGESVQIGGSVCTFKATGKDTRGHAGLFEFTMPRLVLELHHTFTKN